MIVRRNDRQVALRRQPRSDRFPLLVLARHDLGAVSKRRRALQRQSPIGHHDGHRSSQQLAREREAAGVIAGGEGHDAAAPLLGRKAGERMVGSPELERSRALQMLSFEDDLCSQTLVESARAECRGAMGHVLENAASGEDALVSQ